MLYDDAIRWYLPGEIELFIDTVFPVPTNGQVARQMVIEGEALELSPDERLLEETLTHIVKNGVSDTISMLRDNYGLTRPRAREVVRQARETLVEEQEIELEAAFAELRARIEGFINEARQAGRLRETGDGIKMLMQLHGFTRDRDIGGMKDLEETLKRLSKRKVVEHREIHQGSLPALPAAPEPGYTPREGLTREKVIEIPKEARR